MNPHFLFPRVRLGWLALLGLSMAALGCGASNGIYPVHGQVFVQGQPAVGAAVTFHPANASEDAPPRIPTAVVEQDGSFRLTTLSAYDGAPPGEYTVTITWCDVKRDEGDPIDGPDKLQGRYANAKYSTIKATIQSGKNELKRYDLN
ncbi:MAG TPA: carboxypeptidase-like regulatory domain-containing protein [Gemmataceae bacterium]|nr:carboxypeptidase-like regulatory domain-containing protein [Gemmataceae bacterium]